jgi:hypothetical protein
MPSERALGAAPTFRTAIFQKIDFATQILFTATALVSLVKPSPGLFSPVVGVSA